MAEFWQACHTIYQTIGLLHGSYTRHRRSPGGQGARATGVSHHFVTHTPCRPWAEKMLLGVPPAHSMMCPREQVSAGTDVVAPTFTFFVPYIVYPSLNLQDFCFQSVIAAISTSCNRRLAIRDESLANKGQGCGSMDCMWTLVDWTSSHPSG